MEEKQERGGREKRCERRESVGPIGERERKEESEDR